jgi:hypothetical protein
MTCVVFHRPGYSKNRSIEIPGVHSHISAVNRVVIDAAVLERCREV